MSAERVQRGADWLDEVRPGWWKSIDIDALNIAYPTCCVLGRTFAEDASAHGEGSGFGYVLYHLAPSDDSIDSDMWMVEHGFDVDYDDIDSVDFASLRASWVDLINARKAA